MAKVKGPSPKSGGGTKAQHGSSSKSVNTPNAPKRTGASPAQASYDRYQHDTAFRNQVNQFLGLYAGYMGIPELGRTLIDLYNRQVTDPAMITMAIRGTKWYQGHTQIARQWPELSPADQQNQIQQNAVKIANDLRTMYGPQLFDKNYAGGLKNPGILKAAQAIASGQWDYDAWSWQARAAAEKIAGTSAYTALQDEQKRAGQATVDISNLTGKLKDMGAQQFLLPMDQQTAKNWATHINANQASEQDFIDWARKQSSGLYPAFQAQIERGVDPATIMSPYKNLASKELERTVDWTDPLLTGILHANAPDGVMTLGQFQQAIRQTPEWDHTTAARDQGATLETELLKDFGSIK